MDDDPADHVGQVERELAEARESLHSIFAHHPDGVFQIDLEGRFRAVNAAAQRLSGYSEDELLGMSFVELLPDDASVTETVGVFEALLASEPQEFSVHFREKSGTIAELEIVGLPILVADAVVGIYGIAKNVTERRSLERAIVQAQEAAESANQAKSVFLANISHEIRTPLSSVLAAAEMLADSELDAFQRRLVDVMARSGVRLQRLIDQVLDFSRIEAGGVEVVRVPLSLRTLLAEVGETAGSAARARGLDWTLAVEDAVPDLVVGDPMLVAQVLENLLANATKFTDVGEVRLAVTLADLDRTAPDALLRFEVVDTGIGLTPAHQAIMFDAFSQADASITREYGGTGLGLAIVRSLVVELGGSIAVTSTLGQGSRFVVVLPFELAVERAV